MENKVGDQLLVWSLLLFELFGCCCFLLFGRGRVFFCCLGGGPSPAQTAKKKHAPAQTAKKKHAPAPSERVFFLLFGRVGVFIFLLFGRVGVFIFLLFGRWSFFFCLGGGMFFFLLFGPGACFFLLFGRGTGVHSLTRLPGWSLSDPTTKETEQQKKTRVPVWV